MVRAELARKCRDCSFRNGGFLAETFYESRKSLICDAKVAIIVDKNEKVLGWGACFSYDRTYTPEIMVYVRSKCRRKGYGTQIVTKLLSKCPKNQAISVSKPEDDPQNRFYGENIRDCLGEKRLMI